MAVTRGSIFATARVCLVVACVLLLITFMNWEDSGHQGVFRPPDINPYYTMDSGKGTANTDRTGPAGSGRGAAKADRYGPAGSELFEVDLFRTYYITYDEGLKDKPLNDRLLAADAGKSTAEIIQNTKYRVGDRVYVKVVLNDGYGHPIVIGGDCIRARMYEVKAGASIAGHVTDYGNGTHLVTFVTMWAGSPNIDVYLQYTRTTLRAIFYAHEPAAYTKALVGVFRNNNNTKEETHCHPDVTAIMKSRNYPQADLCNLTAVHTGMPFYCIAPKNRQLHCKDWYQVRSLREPVPRSDTFTAAERSLFKSSGARIGDVLNVTISPGNKDSRREMLPACSTAGYQQLWGQEYPVGHFYQNQWYPQHCRLTTPSKYEQCLQGKTLILFGDSTTRQWYVDMEKHMPCKLVTDKWTQPKWHKMSICNDRNHSFTMKWLPHAYAFYNGPGNSVSVPTMKTIPMYIDEIGANDDVIVVIHLFLHSLRFREDIFRIRMAAIRQSVERLFLRNPKAVVAIKGPHAYAYVYSLEDYYGYVYRDITFEVFAGLYHRVIYLDYMEMCSSAGLKDRHPPPMVISEMVRHLLGFACN